MKIVIASLRNEYFWGPVGGKNTMLAHGIFASDTPQKSMLEAGSNYFKKWFLHL